MFTGKRKKCEKCEVTHRGYWDLELGVPFASPVPRDAA